MSRETANNESRDRSRTRSVGERDSESMHLHGPPEIDQPNPGTTLQVIHASSGMDRSWSADLSRCQPLLSTFRGGSLIMVLSYRSGNWRCVQLNINGEIHRFD